MFKKFQHRSLENEWMDDPKVSKELLHKNLHELDILNRFTFGHRISINALKKLVSGGNKEYHIVDLGCGSGDSLKYMAKWARKNNISARFTGVDINANAIEYLKIHCKDYPEINGIQSGYKEYLTSRNKADIFHCSLFCHHLQDDQLTELLAQFKQYADIGFIVNDLIRSPCLYYLTKLFTQISNATPLAKNDGPISVLRGFRIKEFKEMLHKVGISNYKLKFTFGFRFVAVGKIK